MNRSDICAAIDAERERQADKRGGPQLGRRRLFSPAVDDSTKVAGFGGECGEVALAPCSCRRRRHPHRTDPGCRGGGRLAGGTVNDYIIPAQQNAARLRGRVRALRHSDYLFGFPAVYGRLGDPAGTWGAVRRLRHGQRPRWVGVGAERPQTPAKPVLLVTPLAVGFRSSRRRRVRRRRFARCPATDRRRRHDPTTERIDKFNPDDFARRGVRQGPVRSKRLTVCAERR